MNKLLGICSFCPSLKIFTHSLCFHKRYVRTLFSIKALCMWDCECIISHVRDCRAESAVVKQWFCLVFKPKMLKCDLILTHTTNKCSLDDETCMNAGQCLLSLKYHKYTPNLKYRAITANLEKKHLKWMPLKIILWYIHCKKANHVLRHYSETLSVSGSEIKHLNHLCKL